METFNQEEVIRELDSLWLEVTRLIRAGAVPPMVQGHLRNALQQCQQIGRNAQHIIPGQLSLASPIPTVLQHTEEEMETLSARVERIPFVSETLADLTCARRAVNAMSRMGVMFIWQLIEIREKDFLRQKNVGKKTVRATKRALALIGLSFDMCVPYSVREEARKRTTG